MKNKVLVWKATAEESDYPPQKDIKRSMEVLHVKKQNGSYGVNNEWQRCFLPK